MSKELKEKEKMIEETENAIEKCLQNLIDMHNAIVNPKLSEDGIN